MNGKNSAALKPDTVNKNKRDLEASLSVRALAVGAPAIGSLFDNLKLKDDLLAYHYGVDTLLPKLP